MKRLRDDDSDSEREAKRARGNEKVDSLFESAFRRCVGVTSNETLVRIKKILDKELYERGNDETVVLMDSAEGENRHNGRVFGVFPDQIIEPTIIEHLLRKELPEEVAKMSIEKLNTVVKWVFQVWEPDDSDDFKFSDAWLEKMLRKTESVCSQLDITTDLYKSLLTVFNCRTFILIRDPIVDGRETQNIVVTEIADKCEDLDLELPLSDIAWEYYTFRVPLGSTYEIKHDEKRQYPIIANTYDGETHIDHRTIVNDCTTYPRWFTG